MERCLACEADAIATMEGSRFYPKPVCTHIFETSRIYSLGVSEQAAPANVSRCPNPTVTHFVPYHATR